MTKKIKQKEFEGVKTMLAIKAKLGKRYWNNPDLFLKEMEEINIKYMLYLPNRKKITL